MRPAIEIRTLAVLASLSACALGPEDGELAQDEEPGDSLEYVGVDGEQANTGQHAVISSGGLESADAPISAAGFIEASYTRCSPRWTRGSDWFQGCIRIAVYRDLGGGYFVRDELSLTASRPMAVHLQIDGLWVAYPQPSYGWRRDGVVANWPEVTNVSNLSWGGDYRQSHWYTAGAIFRNVWPDGAVGGWYPLDGDACWFTGNQLQLCFQR